MGDQQRFFDGGGDVGLKQTWGLSSNQLKILAMLTMTLDHIGLMLLPGIPVLRILGRLAMPIYAYLIAQGCRYTRSRRRYLSRLFLLGAVCQVVYYLVDGSLYQCILITFSLSVCMIGTIDRALHRRTAAAWTLAGAAVLAAAFVCLGLPWLLPGTDFALDYGLLGALLPVAAYYGGLPWFAVVLALLSWQSGGIQWWSLGALGPLLLYNGRRGERKLGRFFYLYYPAHLAAIWALGLLIR